MRIVKSLTERAKLPWRFTQPSFTVYNGRTDPMEHVSHFNQKMVVHSRNETLMCKVFPSSLGPVAMRWFNGLEEGSISSFQELTKAFGARFVTCSRVPRLLDSLLSMAMQEDETLKTYSNRYYKRFNKIDENFEDVAIRTFKDQQQGKGKVKVTPHYRKDFKSERYNKNRPKRDFAGHTRHTTAQVVNIMFRELVHQILKKIKNEPYFKWPSKMGGGPMKCNQSLHCQYHQNEGHTMEDCRTLRDYLEQLVKIRKLKQFLYQPPRQGSQVESAHQRDASSRLPLGIISAILASPGRTVAYP
ncbi:uncharacterized protein LOC112012780 [Quercus suber]|uniref:uncharacterized protein LOC112012780 n=1 Tax=Quercus suber TaxID=58331 RepID=UPI0032DFA0EE